MLVRLCVCGDVSNHFRRYFTLFDRLLVFVFVFVNSTISDLIEIIRRDAPTLQIFHKRSMSYFCGWGLFFEFECNVSNGWCFAIISSPSVLTLSNRDAHFLS